MNDVINFLFHPVVLAILGIALVVFVFYLLKSFVKIVLISILVIFFSIIGYHYYHAEGKFNDRMRESLMGTKGQIGRWIDKGKEAAFWGKKIFDQRKGNESEKREPPKKKSHLEDV